VIDGATRDTLQITEMAFPVFASHVSVSYPGKRGPGAVNVPVVMAGVTVNPGDLIVGTRMACLPFRRRTSKPQFEMPKLGWQRRPTPSGDSTKGRRCTI
jgi:hypothetical protein